jgi:hypothetical protein
MGDADITLRHIVRRHPEALIQPLEVQGRVEVVGWLDTQVTTLERRLDSAVGLRVEGELRALHVEFAYELTRNMGRRIYVYQALFNLGRASERPGEAVPPIESLVVVLTGRKKPWPPDGKHRTGWPGRRWSGVRYRIDAVYQRTVEELRVRGSVLWLVFTPLARDATVGSVRRVVDELRERVQDAEELADLYTALLVMADVDPWGHTLREEIAAMLESEGRDLIEVSKTLRDAFEKGEKKGIERGIERGEKKGIEKMLARLFVRRLGRALTEREQQALAARTRAQAPEEVEDRALDLEGEALAAWLLDPDAK